MTIANLQKQLKRVTEDRDSLQELSDLQWKADMRAVKLWREANPGNELVLPDRCCLVTWLLETYVK